MKDLRGQIDKIKKSLAIKAGDDQTTRKAFKEALIEAFPDINNPLRYVKDYYFKNTKFFISTTNKSFANELFFKKADLLLKIDKKGKIQIKELIIK